MHHTTEKNSVSEKLTNTSHGLLNESSRKLIEIIFSRLEREMTLATIIDPENPKSIELKNFILDIASLSDYIHTEIYKKDENPDAEVFFHADKLPVVSLIDDENYYMGVKFHSLALPHALSSFILAIYYLAGPRVALSTELAAKLIAIDKPADIKICVSHSCDFCSDTVVAAQRIALLNPKVQAEMIDLDLFPDIKIKYHIKSLPALIINDETVSFGPKTMEEIIHLISI